MKDQVGFKYVPQIQPHSVALLYGKMPMLRLKLVLHLKRKIKILLILVFLIQEEAVAMQLYGNSKVAIGVMFSNWMKTMDNLVSTKLNWIMNPRSAMI